MTALSVRSWTTLLCALLMLALAGVQGVNRLDRMQHDFVGAMAHDHGPLSILTGEDGDHDAARMVADAGDPASSDGPPVHHHHGGDHGSGIPGLALATEAVALPAAPRQMIAHSRAVVGRAVTALERPPRLSPTTV